MVHVDKIEFGPLKEAIKELNASGLVEATLKTIGVGKEVMATNFIEAIEALTDEAAEQLPEGCVDMYNVLVSDEVEAVEAAAAAAPEKTAKAPKAEKAPKAPKAEKSPKAEKAQKAQKARGPFGSVVGSLANNIDELVAKGTTIEDIMAKAAVTRSRAVTHIKFIEKERGVVVTKTDDKIIGVLSVK